MPRGWVSEHSGAQVLLWQMSLVIRSSEARWYHLSGQRLASDLCADPATAQCGGSQVSQKAMPLRGAARLGLSGCWLMPAHRENAIYFPSL